MKKSCHKVTAVIPALLLVACVDNRNDFTGASPNSEETTSSLPAPENLSATASDNEVSLSWDTVDGASAYNVYIYNQSDYIQSNYSPANLSAADASASAIVSTNSHLLSSLEYEVDYYFNVTALADDLESNQSNEVGVRPLQNFNNSTPSVQLLNTNVNAAEVVTLSAEVSDPDGNNISYLWQQTSGASIDIIDGNESEVTFTAPTVDAPVELGFALTVFDNLGASSTSSATVTVSDNLSPQVDAGADQSVSPGATVDLLGSASDSDGSVVDIAWQQESGSIVSLSSNSTLDTSFTAPSANSSELTLVFRLSVTDDRGASVTDTVSVIVAADQATTTVYRVDVAENSNGTIHVATTNDPEQESLTFSLSGTDANDFSIDSSSGAISFISTPDYEVPIDTNTDNAYELTFEVSNGTTTTLQELVITVIDVDEAPTITSAPDASTPENTTITYTATATDPENNPLSYSLSGTDAANFTINPSSGAISFTTIPDYENPADSDANNVYALTLEVSDSTHTTSQALSITVTNIDEAPSITSATAANILENTTTTIYTASASDPENDALSYSLSGTDAAHLSINPSSGAISFAINPDHENPTDADANNIYELTLEVSDSTHTTSQALAITVDDTNDNAPIITAAQSFSIDENSANGTAIGTVIATDADASPTTYQDWTITSGNTNAAFAIDSSSGELSVATSAELDYESTASYTLELSVSDGVNTASAETVTINVNDLNDNTPVITAAQSFSIDENSANGSIIGIVAATDADTIPTTYQDWTITSGNTNAAFAIDSSSGELSVATSSELDYESTASYTLALSVSDGVNTASAETLSINLSNVNEQPSFTSAATASANENDSSFAYTASATDVDAADSLGYSISGGADAAAFSLSGASLGFIAAANYESPADSNQDNIYEVELQVTDAGGLSDYLDLQISVTDLNEYDVSFSESSQDANTSANAIAENATAGTAVGITASASDSDGTNNTISYSFADSELTSGPFSIDSSSGVVMVTSDNSLDYEDADSYSLVIYATSSDGSNASASFTVIVADINEHDVIAPIDIDTANANNEVAENAGAGTAVGITASASDADGTNNTISYSFADSELTSGPFSIDSSSGVVTVTSDNSLDYEDADSYSLVIYATSSDGSNASASFTVIVTDINEHDVIAPTDIDTANANNEVAENAGAGTAVGITASASDADGTNNTISYSFADSELTSGPFSIDSSSGVVMVTSDNSLDYEDADSYSLVIYATSSDGSNASASFTVIVTDINEHDVIAPTDIDTANANNEVAENAGAGTAVGITASASDADGTNNTISYSFADSELTSGPFSIDSSSGVVMVTSDNSLDYEDADSYSLVIYATSSDGSNASASFTVIVTDINEHDVIAPTDIDTANANNEVAENAGAGTAVGITASASDADGTNNTISYSFADSELTSGPFSIDSSSGVVMVTSDNSLDYEDADSYSLVIYATSSDGSNASASFTVIVTDINEHDVIAPIDIDTANANNEVAENAGAGTDVGITASASDADGTNNTISYSFADSELTSGPFSIDSSSGVVMVTSDNSLDYEDADSYSLVIYATSSDGSNASASFTVIVTDINEHDVIAPIDIDTANANNEVAENAGAGTAVGITASASDADGTNNTISYSFADSELTSGPFSIDSSSGVVMVTSDNSLDYEDADSYSLVIYATSSDGSNASASFTVIVTDINEHDVIAPIDIDTANANNEVAENAGAGTAVGITASASDADGTNNTISYSFADSELTSGPFSIDSSSGVVMVTSDNSLDYEDADSYSLVIYATSSDGSNASASFTVIVTDINEHDVIAPTDIDTANANNEVAENAGAGTAVGITASASDADGTNNTISYSFADSELTSGPFSIDSSSGVVMVTSDNSLDYEDADSYSLVIYATSSDGSNASASFTVIVTDINEHDVIAPIDIDTANANNEVAENAGAGTAVGITASASDADGTNNTISYSFADSELTSGPFSIDSSSGVVTVTSDNSLDYEDADSYSLVIYATSSDGSNASASFTVIVTDINEHDVIAPIDIDTANANNEVAENAGAGTAVGITASASDADGTNNTISYSFADSELTSGPFSIDSSSGVVMVTSDNSLDYEDADSYSLVIYATSSDGSNASASFNVIVTDINEHDVIAPIDIDTANANNEVAENAGAGTAVGITASASDADGTNNTISYSFADSELTSGPFSIDSSSGVVMVTSDNSLDYEDADSYSLVIYATSSDGSNASASFTVIVTDINEHDVIAPIDIDTANANNEVAENAGAGTAVGITASASDADGTNNTISYSFADSELTSGPFSIDSSSGVVMVTSDNSLDYEDADSYSLVIYATSSDGSNASASFTVIVTDINEHDVIAPIDIDTANANNEVAENAGAGTAVGITASASDADGTNNTISYSFADSELTSGPFSIDSSSGVVMVTSDNSLDYEDADSYSLVIYATSSDGSNASASFTVIVTDINEHDVIAPIDIDTANANNEVAENAGAGTAVGITASASDADGTNNTISYSFADSELTSGPFSIDSSSGVVTVTSDNSLDYEDADSYSLVIYATSSDGSNASASFTVIVTDINEHDVIAPTDIDTANANNEVAENAGAGTAVGITASASDADGTNNTISYSFADSELTSGPFSIDSSSGVVMVTSDNSLDYEDADSYSLVIYATSSDGSNASASFTVIVTDINEHDVIAPIDIDTANANNEVAENAGAGTAVGITASASDADGTNNTISYSFADSELTSGPFSIDSSSGVVMVTSDNSLDYEDADSYSLVIYATSSDGSNASASFTVIVTDINEHDVIAPTDIDTANANNEVAENAGAGTAVGITASASDADGTNNTISYSFADSELTSGPFSIDSSSGVVMVTSDNSLDYEDADSYSLVIYATSSDGSNASASFTVIVTDINEHDVIAPIDIDTANANNEVAENAGAGTAVGITASASDADGTNNTISYSFADSELTSGPFSIDSSSGVVTVTSDNSLDYEDADSYSLVIYATSSDGSNASASFTVIVTDINEHDVIAPTDIDTANANNEVAENAGAGTAVGITASASDADGTNNTISYSFDKDSQTSGFFSIDASSGVVTLANSNSLDYETATSHDIVIKASSSDGSTDSESFTVAVTDVDEFDVTPPTDSDSDTNQIAENSNSGTTVGITASASDGDGTNNTVSYSFDNDLLTSGFFSIDASSGVVTLTNSNNLDYETATSHDIVIKATSTDGSTATSSTLTINVIDHDEFDVSTPTDSDSATNQIAENASSGTTVGITAAASDDDGTNNTVSYSFDNDSQTSADNLFSIASDTGIVTLANSNSLDYETATSHDIVVKATSSDGSTDSETFTVSVTDVNDNTPIITPSQSFDIDEASANDTSLGTVGFTDADSDAVNTFTWSITDGNTNDAFAIDDSTGEITVAISSELDYESGTILYTLSLTVSDGATTSAAEAITINILDVSEHDAAPSAAYLGLPDNYINITFTPEGGVSYQLHRSFVEGCTSSSCDAEGYKSFASPDSGGTADTMTFSQTHYYSLVGDNSTTFTTSINDSDGAKLAALVAAQSLSTEYDLTNDWVNISATDSNNVTYTLYMAGEPFAAGGCEDSELDNIGSLCADGSSLSDGSMHSATEVINWSARRYYRLDISDGYQVVHSLESNASVIDPVVLSASNASLTIDITWTALNSAKLAEYTVYLSDDSAATTASTATWSSLSNSRIISGNSSELYSLVPILSQYYVAITATNTESETTPLSKVYLANNIVTGDPNPSTWHEIIADTDDSPAHWEGRSTHGSLVFQDKMWLIGGRTASENHIAEVWSSTDGYNWTEVTPSAAFGARKEFVSMVHDGKMWVLGGEIEGNLLANDVWYSSDGATWHEATPAASWHVRDYFGGVAFASGATGSDEMWVLGHYTGDARGIPGVEDHHYSTDGSTWSSVSVSGLPPSSFFPAITFNNVILIVGGYFYTNSAWSESNTIYSSTDGVNWAELSVSGSIWDARRLHTTLVYDDKLWVLAGYSGYNRDDYWYSPDGTQWHEVMASGSKWEARQVHTSVNYAGRMWMLGGYGSTGDKQLNDVWASGLEITSFSFQEVLSNSL